MVKPAQIEHESNLKWKENLAVKWEGARNDPTMNKPVEARNAEFSALGVPNSPFIYLRTVLMSCRNPRSEGVPGGRRVKLGLPG